MSTATAEERKVTVNEAQRMYIIPCGDGVCSCWGFDNDWRETQALAEKMGIVCNPWPAPGSLALYDFHSQLCKELKDHPDKYKIGTWFDPRTPEKVQRVLERLRKADSLVRVWCGDPETGEAWLEEQDCVGKIGRSTGPLKIPLLVPLRSRGGPALFTERVLRIVTLETDAGGGAEKEIYKHPKFHLPEMELVKTTDPALLEAYPATVLVKGEEYARFDSMAEGAQFIALMHGLNHNFKDHREEDET